MDEFTLDILQKFDSSDVVLLNQKKKRKIHWYVILQEQICVLAK